MAAHVTLRIGGSSAALGGDKTTRDRPMIRVTAATWQRTRRQLRLCISESKLIEAAIENFLSEQNVVGAGLGGRLTQAGVEEGDRSTDI